MGLALLKGIRVYLDSLPSIHDENAALRARVEELQEEVEASEGIFSLYHDAQHRISQLEDGLRFYADPKTWEPPEIIEGYVGMMYTPIYEDQGEKARSLLKGGSDEGN